MAAEVVTLRKFIDFVDWVVNYFPFHPWVSRVNTWSRDAELFQELLNAGDPDAVEWWTKWMLLK